jgi:hypothetical protein
MIPELRTTGKFGSRRRGGSVRRISVSLPEGVFRELDEMVAQRRIGESLQGHCRDDMHFVLARRETAGDR